MTEESVVSKNTRLVLGTVSAAVGAVLYFQGLGPRRLRL